MKKGRKGIHIHINLTNRWLYTFIAVGILALIGVGVYALTPGVSPNPGHSISDVAPPSSCSSNQVLQWSGTAWVCVTPSSLPTCAANQAPRFDGTNWVCANVITSNIPVYKTLMFCVPAQPLTLSSTCATATCGPCSHGTGCYYTCQGACNYGGPNTCSNTAVGNVLYG